MTKCLKCMRPHIGCMCKHLTPINTRTHFVILMHPMEFKREKNGTGRLTHLQLKNSKIIVDIDFTQNAEVNALLADPENRCYLLYPGKNCVNLSAPRCQEKAQALSTGRRVIFLIDGTWGHAKKMLRLSTNLHGLPRLSFDNSDVSQFILKQQPSPQCLSTIEATHKVINLLNAWDLEQADTSTFLRPFQKMIEFQVECVRNPHNKSYRTKTLPIIREKTMYRKEKRGFGLFFAD